MSFHELTAYIADLRQSGFDTTKLSVQLNRKLAYPAITLVMAILAIPFALATGKRGGVAGFAIAICSPSSTSASPACLRPWATSTPCPPSSPPGRPTSSSPSPEPGSSSAPPPKPPQTPQSKSLP